MTTEGPVRATGIFPQGKSQWSIKGSQERGWGTTEGQGRDLISSEDFWELVRTQLVQGLGWENEGFPHTEDIKIIEQEVHSGEDIKKHTLALIWKQSFGRTCRSGADLAVLSGLESWGCISQLIKFLWASGRLLPLSNQTAA